MAYSHILFLFDFLWSGSGHGSAETSALLRALQAVPDVGLSGIQTTSSVQVWQNHFRPTWDSLARVMPPLAPRAYLSVMPVVSSPP